MARTLNAADRNQGPTRRSASALPFLLPTFESTLSREATAITNHMEGVHS